MEIKNQEFLDRIFEKLDQLNIDVSEFKFDHLAYQTSSKDEFDNLHQKLINQSIDYSIVLVDGRRVGAYLLKVPLKHGKYQIQIYETVEPKKGQICKSALDHVEFLINSDFQSLIDKYPYLNWDKKGIDNKEFARLSLNLGDDLKIKFNQKSIWDENQNLHEEFMKVALEEAKLSAKEGNAPFAVVVVDENKKIVWKDHDRVKEQMDPTAHGEINAIRKLCGRRKSLSLKGLIFYTTSEPCPTCLSAMIKAQVSQCFYGAKTEKSASLPISSEELVKYAKKYPIKIKGGILENECLVQRKSLIN